MAFINIVISWIAVIIFVLLFLISDDKKKLLMMQPRSPRAWKLFSGALLCFFVFDFGTEQLVLNPLPTSTLDFLFYAGLNDLSFYVSLFSPVTEEAGRLGLLLPLSQISIGLSVLVSTVNFVLGHGDSQILTLSNQVGIYFIWTVSSLFLTFVALRFGFVCTVLAHIAINVVVLGGVIYFPAPFTFLNWLLPLTFLALAFVLVAKQKDSILNYDCGLLTIPADRRKPEHEAAIND